MVFGLIGHWGFAIGHSTAIARSPTGPADSAIRCTIAARPGQALYCGI
jgi:hypothetical protein